MKFIRQAIPDIILIKPRLFRDGRGFFFESYREDIFRPNGITERFLQDNHVRSVKGVLRGLHYQLAPRAQAKLVRVTRGAIYDVAVDVRRTSPTCGAFVGLTLRAEDAWMVYVPPGFAHGYLALEDLTEVLYKVSEVYSPEHERGVAWNDPAIAIPWPSLDLPVLLSDKDRRNPALSAAELFA